MEAARIRHEFEVQGRSWFRNVLSDRELAVLDAAVDLDDRAGERLDPTAALKAALSGDDGLGAIMRVFADNLIPARIVAFNKTEANNWGVPWHQDRVIAVADRHEDPNFTNWSRKAGTWHCEPPASFLERMFFVRVHLDSGGQDEGPMRIALGSHRLGIVPSGNAREIAEGLPQEECLAARGDVLVLKMLTLHASSPSSSANPRRVFRVDYAPSDLLPPPFAWL